MSSYNYDDKFMYSLYDKMEKQLKHHRYIHSVGVAGIAAALAMKYDEDVFKAQIAGILHDCAKSYKDDELIEQTLKEIDEYDMSTEAAEKIDMLRVCFEARDYAGMLGIIDNGGEI